MDYEPITKELREYVRDNTSRNGNCWWQLEDTNAVIAFCDNIDAIHRSLEHENERLRNASERGDDWIKLPVDAEAPSKQLADWLERRGLVTGPLDANGELWHSGDMSASNWGVIEGIYFENGVWFISGHDISAPWIRADSIVHYHPDTWERIIEDAINTHGNGFNPSWTETRDALVARCKALAGEGE